MADFLLELASEEIPARMQAAAAEQLRTRFTDGLKGRVAFDRIDTFVTPRRLALYAHGLPETGAATAEERRGPRTDAPAAALDGFLRSTGLTRDQLEARETPKGTFYYAHIHSEGRATAELLAELIPAIVRDFDWPKSMRWGAASVVSSSPRWVRPLTGIVALLDDHVVPFEVAGIASGRTTRGHRFLSHGPIDIAHPRFYARALRDAHVIIDPAERRTIISDRAWALARAAGLTLIEDDGLTQENAGLTEWPVPLLGHFDPAFLDVPPEIIQLTMRTNQKYFAAKNADGSLAPVFIAVANIAANDGGDAIAAGNARVLSARLSDAKFFWDADVAKVRAGGLEAFTPKLADIVFHEKLGTVADKVDRVAKLARWLIESGAIKPSPPSGGEGDSPQASGERGQAPAAADPPLPGPREAARLSPSPPEGGEGALSLADHAELAARLCKADLVTATVGEFPEVQGLVGGYLALVPSPRRGEGDSAQPSGERGLAPLPQAVADAIRDHYKPVGPSDAVPTAPVTVAVALADKLDTIAGFFMVGEKPTGSKDPYALRRASIGVMRMIFASGIRGSLTGWLGEARQYYRAQGIVDLRPELLPAETLRGEIEQQYRRIYMSEVNDFVQDRLKVQQREAGVRHDLIDAVFALGGEDDLVRLLARVHALQAFLATDDGANLLAGYRRAANILRGEAKKDGVVRYDAEPETAAPHTPADTTLAHMLVPVAAAAQAAIESEDFTTAMAALAQLRGPIDAFFDAVMVNDPDPKIRHMRLSLLQRFSDAVHEVADFSKVEG